MAVNSRGRGENPSSGRGSSSKKSTRSNVSNKGTSKRGFAAMDEDKQREIARKGGAASHGGGRRGGSSRGGNR